MPNWKKIVLSGSSANLNNLYTENAVTASFFKGDGSAITNVSATVAEVATVSDTFTNATSKEVTHNFGSKNVVVSVYNNSDQLLIPASITTTTSNTVDIAFDSSTTGRVVVAKGGHIVSGSASTAGNGFPFTGSAEISGSLTVTGSVKLTGQLKVGDLSQASSRDVSFDDRFNLLAANNQSANILFGDPDDDGKGSIRYQNSDDSFEFRTDGDSALIISSNQTASFANLVSASRFRGKSAQIYDASNFAYFSHVNRSTPSNYSFMSSPLGSTFINSSGSSQKVHILEKNGSVATFCRDDISLHANNTKVIHKGAFEVYNNSGSYSNKLTLRLSDETGSFSGLVSASHFKGDGSQLTNINASAIGSGIGFFPPSNPSAGGNFELGTSYSLSVLNNGSGILSGSSQIDNLTRFEQTLTGDTSYTITHNLNEDYPIVQVYDNSKFQVIPASVKVTNANVVDLTFSTFANLEGKVIVKK